MDANPSAGPLDVAAELAAVEGRAAGTDAERRAAAKLEQRLVALGREVQLEPISVFPRYPITRVLEALLGVAGSVVAVSEPIVGTALVAAATLSAFADLTAALPLLRRLTGRRASQNVVSRDDEDKPGTLVLVADYDAGHGGALFTRRALERRARIGRVLRRPIGPFEPFFWSLVAVLVCCGVRLAGVDATALTVVQFIPTVVLIAAVPLLADIALSPISPGANDNASGVATALRLAERYSGRLEHFDIWLVLTGADAGMPLGTREFLRSHRGELDKPSTAFVYIRRVGDGPVGYITREGNVIASEYHPTLLELSTEIHDASPLRSRTPTAATLARAGGFPAVAVTCTGERGVALGHGQSTDTADRLDPDALEDAYRFCCELVELIDERIGPEL